MNVSAELTVRSGARSGASNAGIAGFGTSVRLCFFASMDCTITQMKLMNRVYLSAQICRVLEAQYNLLKFGVVSQAYFIGNCGKRQSWFDKVDPKIANELSAGAYIANLEPILVNQRHFSTFN